MDQICQYLFKPISVIVLEYSDNTLTEKQDRVLKLITLANVGSLDSDMYRIRIERINFKIVYCLKCGNPADFESKGVLCECTLCDNCDLANELCRCIIPV